MCYSSVMLVINYFFLLETTAYVIHQGIVQFRSLPVAAHFIVPAQEMGFVNQYNNNHNTFTRESLSEYKYYGQKVPEKIQQQPINWDFPHQSLTSSFNPQNGQLIDRTPSDVTNSGDRNYGNREQTNNNDVDNRMNTLERKLEDLREKILTNKQDKDKFEIVNREANEILKELKLLENTNLPNQSLIRLKLLIEKVNNFKEDILSNIKNTLINPLVDQINELLKQLESIKVSLLTRTNQYTVKDVREKLKDLKITLLTSSDLNILQTIQPQIQAIVSELDGIKCLGLSSNLKATIAKFGSVLSGVAGFILGVPMVILG